MTSWQIIVHTRVYHMWNINAVLMDINEKLFDVGVNVFDIHSLEVGIIKEGFRIASERVVKEREYQYEELVKSIKTVIDGKLKIIKPLNKNNLIEKIVE
jgi:hypothetical protein